MPEHADAIRRGEIPQPLVGFPDSDVFRYEDEVVEEANIIDWDRLAPMKEAAN
jgi:hypothetical protein